MSQRASRRPRRTAGLRLHVRRVARRLDDHLDSGVGRPPLGQELRRALREIRTAIDKYKDAADTATISPLEIKVGTEGYPPDLQALVNGVSRANDVTGRKLKFLRKVPIDPMTRSTEWGLRSYQDKPDASSWGGQNVFDVHTTFPGTALDGTKYRDW